MFEALGNRLTGVFDKLRRRGALSEADVQEALREVRVALLEADVALPVVKILDYGKYKYEQQKKANEARKRQKVVEIKEIKVRPNIDDHDYDVKMRQAKDFIGEGDKVKVTLRFRGREMAHQDLGLKVLDRIRTEMADITKVEQMPRLENRQMIMVLAPK